MSPKNSSSSATPKSPKASQLASDIKKYYLPNLLAQGGKTEARLYRHPGRLHPPQAHPVVGARQGSCTPNGVPEFIVTPQDPVAAALHAQSQVWAHWQLCTPIICPANERRPGGDWETAVTGFEESLCRRSSLSASLASVPYPLPACGAVFSPCVTIFRDQHNAELPHHHATVPVVSVAPVRWPKLTHGGTLYSFDEEREMVRQKARAALLICAENRLPVLIISGDFGLGKNFRNPPGEVALMWRDLFLWDTELRAQFEQVVFAFANPAQCTMRDIADDVERKRQKESASKAAKANAATAAPSRQKAKSRSAPAPGPDYYQATAAPDSLYQSDMEIFADAFSTAAVQKARFSMNAFVH